VPQRLTLRPAFTAALLVSVWIYLWERFNRSVQSLSSIAGCRYMSVASTEEFTNSIADEFAHDVTPIALNIRFELASGGAWTFEKGVGSAELN
jgi:hypothetical protein